MAIKGLWPNSLKNSSDTLLSAGETFTGEPEGISQTEQPQSVSVTVFSDVDGTKDGLQLQQSADGNNWDSVDKFTVEANKIKVVPLNLHQRYFRVVYRTENTQTLFRLQTRFNTRPVPETDPDKASTVQVSYKGELVDQDRTAHAQTSQVELLSEILLEARITNLHLAQLTGEDFTELDIETKG